MVRIVGIYHRDQREVSASNLEKMLEQMNKQELQQRYLWFQDCVGFGSIPLNQTSPHLTAKTTKLSYSDVQVISDARLDNRQDLIATLELQPEASNSQILIKAYLKWGFDCPQQLLGDFAFAIWDPHQNQLFCARDPLGIKPLFLYISSSFVAFASEIGGILALEDIPCQINDLHIARYLVQKNHRMDPILDEQPSTLFQNIVPLPGGHWVMITPEKIYEQRYWQLDPAQEIHMQSSLDYVETFRNIFSEAVSSRMGNDSREIGVVLSGGLDSSSVASVIRKHSTLNAPIPTFTAVFPHLPPHEFRYIDDPPYLRALIDEGGFQPHLYEADLLSPLRDGDQVYSQLDECFVAPNFYLHRTAFKLATQQGVRRLFDGLDGDVVVSHGSRRLRELAQSGQWIQLAQQMAVAQMYWISPWHLYWRFLWSYGLKPKIIRGPLRKLSQPQSGPAYGNLVHPELAQRFDLQDRLQERQRRHSLHTGVRGEHFLGLTSGLVQIALDTVNRAATASGLEIHHPFFDRRLVEFCLALPAQQKLDEGWTRIILRRAVEGMIPPQVQWRQRKADLSASFNRGFVSFEWELLESYCQERLTHLAPYIRQETLIQSIEILRQAKAKGDFTPRKVSEAATTAWVVVNLDQWLRKTAELTCR